ncbi:CRISPR-associated helicase Cas3 [Clostridiaceae bacterium JG1575]|nr:CRISPR-associated helicase Cas3 [Clostridiaceae bacterium JG1575]
MEYLAHSAKADSIAQTYSDHVAGVCHRAEWYANEAERYSPICEGQLKEIVRRSALWHDLGKLDDDNQAVLHDPSYKQRHLPWNHTDAGSAALKASDSLYSALIVYSHHIGLPDMESEGARGKNFFRDDRYSVRNHFDFELTKLLRRHTEILSMDGRGVEEPTRADLPLFFRMALSCLADADHTDTAVAYRQVPECENLPQLCAEKRLKKLNKYVSELSSDDERSHLRSEMYFACRDATVTGGFTACDSPVGSGKTTAVMAHLLKQAMERNARRVFVVLPYTNIIKQSVDIYRKSLVLPGENPEEVVAELHCRADFQDKDTRYLTSRWRAPIIVTTAVAFFETLASNRPSALRRLHALPGSVVFVDEAHNALPLKLLPLAWRWMYKLAEEWSCYWVLASGSLVRYWMLDSLKPVEMLQPIVNELINEKLREQLMRYERHRVTFRWRPEAISRKELMDWVQSMPGPRLLIVNTVQSAAAIANDFCSTYGRYSVEHLSTALTAEDRSSTIERVKVRLKDERETDWTLVATSCVEAGVDFSFRSGFRELSSLLSLLQASGRVNRSGLYPGSVMWSFTLQDDSILKKNPALETSREVLRSYFAKNAEIAPVLSTKSMNDEIIQDDSCLKTIKRLNALENLNQFDTVCNEFAVIESNTVPVVIDDDLVKSIEYGLGDWQLLQKKSVSIRRENIKAWNVKELANGVFHWTLEYDSFLGYMRGVLDIQKSKNDMLMD